MHKMMRRNIDANADVIAFPAENAVENMMRSFVIKDGEALQADPNGKYKSHNHDHQLHLISSTPQDQAKEKESVNDDDEDDDEYLQYGNKTKLICDGCTMPISQNKYMSCSECKYFLHLPCSQLPPQLHSHPLHHEHPYNVLTLQTNPKLICSYCDACGFLTNGLFYRCTECCFEADVKCASLPNTIKHAAHPYHHLKLLYGKDTKNTNYWRRPCRACGTGTHSAVCYICNICEYILHASCCLLPKSVTNRTWDKHPLLLTFDGGLDHPSSFYCEVCEEEMSAKRWMYQCRDCDVSIHLYCLRTESGEYRNMKFGQRYVAAGVHGHPLSYQLLTTKLRCDVCKERKDYCTTES